MNLKTPASLIAATAVAALALPGSASAATVSVDTGTATDTVEMIIGQARDDPLSAKIDLPRRRSRQRPYLRRLPNSDEFAARDRHCFRHFATRVQRDDTSIIKNQIGCGRDL